MKIFKKLFQRKKQEPQPLHIEGVPEAPMTAEPDDAELAALALLESLVNKKRKKSDADGKEPEKGTAEYYRRLASKIRAAQDTSTLRTMRFVSFVEQELKKDDLPATGDGSLALLEAELMKRIDTVDRVGGDLKKRWQHCVANIVVRLMRLDVETTQNGNVAPR